MVELNESETLLRLKMFSNVRVANYLYLCIWIGQISIWLAFVTQVGKYPYLRQVEAFLPLCNFIAWASLIVLLKRTSVGIWLYSNATSAQAVFVNVTHFLIVTYSMLPFGMIALVYLILHPLLRPSLASLFHSFSTILILLGITVLPSALFVSVLFSPAELVGRKRSNQLAK